MSLHKIPKWYDAILYCYINYGYSCHKIDKNRLLPCLDTILLQKLVFLK